MLKLIESLAVHLSVRAEVTGVFKLVLVPVFHSLIDCLVGVEVIGLLSSLKWMLSEY